jgi:hypothetical protein
MQKQTWHPLSSPPAAAHAAAHAAAVVEAAEAVSAVGSMLTVSKRFELAPPLDWNWLTQSSARVEPCVSHNDESAVGKQQTCKIIGDFGQINPWVFDGALGGEAPCP